jgi:nucleoid DNA-binding protein
MKKSDVIEALAAKEGLKQNEAYSIVNMIFDGFTDTLFDGRENRDQRIREFLCQEIWCLHGKESEDRGKS